MKKILLGLVVLVGIGLGLFVLVVIGLTHYMDSALEGYEPTDKNVVMYCDSEPYPFNGMVRFYYENGQLIYEGNYKDGYPDTLNNIEESSDDDYPAAKSTDSMPTSAKPSTQHLDKDIVMYYEGNPFNGMVRFYYQSGQLKHEGNYQDGKRDGLLKGWHENGQLESENNYKDGKSHGSGWWYFQNGQLNWESNCKDGVFVGIQRYWWTNGQLREEENWEDGKLKSIKKWDEEGNPKKNSTDKFWLWLYDKLNIKPDY